MLLGYKITLAFMRILSLLCVCFLSLFVSNVSAQVVEKVFDILGRDSLSVQRNIAVSDSDSIRLVDIQAELAAAKLNEANLRMEVEQMKLAAFVADSLKLAIVRDADGEGGNVNDIQNQDDLEASSKIRVTYGNGEKLRQRLTKYSDYISAFIPDAKKRDAIKKALATDPITQKGTLVKTPWVSGMFENMPVVAAVTLLSKLQNDLLFAEGEALTALLNNVDAGDVRVNQLDAFVIPSSKLVMRGGKYAADIVLAAVDTTQRPSIFINGKMLPENTRTYELYTGQTGTFTYSGYLEVTRGDGTTSRHPFQSDYTVIEPMATVSATMMNVLYAGIDNPISISVPGVAQNAVSATMTNGSLTRSGDIWKARPTQVGAECVITVTAAIDGKPQTVSASTFRVRKLPDPTAYIAYKDNHGNEVRYKGSRPLAKSILLSAEGVEAAIDDDLLNVQYTVLDFETIVFDSMGNAIPEKSNGSKFSERQKTSFRRLSRGKRFYISRVRAKGPDGIIRDLSPVEVIVN